MGRVCHVELRLYRGHTVKLSMPSRTMLAGMVAPAEASWGALMVLYTACLRYGVPETLISDSGGAFTSTAFKAVLLSFTKVD